MAKIVTLQQFKYYVKLRLGMPIVNLEVSDSQIEQIIEDCLDIFCRYMYEEGSYMDYAILNVSACQSEIPLSAAFDQRTGQNLTNIQDIYDYSLSFAADGINTLFSPTHVLLYDQFVNKGDYPGGPGTGVGVIAGNTGLTLTNYQISMMYLKDIEMMFGKYYRISYINGLDVLKIVPTPVQNLTGVLMFYRRQMAVNLYNHPLVKRLVLAKTKQQWGNNLGKYNATLPNGTTINYDRLIQQGLDEEEKVMDDIRSEGAPIDFYIA